VLLGTQVTALQNSCSLDNVLTEEVVYVTRATFPLSCECAICYSSFHLGYA
jgi:hypothetical protein